LEKREREKRIQQFGLITQQQQPSEQSSSSRKRSQIEINENICGILKIFKLAKKIFFSRRRTTTNGPDTL